MPTSWYQVIPTVLELVERCQPRTVLDVGVGFGKYGALLRDALEVPLGRYHKPQWKLRIDGVEVFPGYQNPLHEYCYDRVYYGDIMHLVDQLPRYDLILLIDVLEHLEKGQGTKLLHALLRHCARCLLASTPLYPAQQGSYLGNQGEIHRSRWVVTDFLDFDFSYRLVPIGTNAAQLFAVFPPRSGLALPEEAEIVPEPCAAGPHPMRIAGYLPHTNLTGGLKTYLAHLRWLQLRGHQIVLFTREGDTQGATPSWSDFVPDAVISVPPGESLEAVIRSASCDVLFVVWWEQLPELVRTGAPVVYWENGHEGLYGELNDLSPDSPLRGRMAHCYRH